MHEELVFNEQKLQDVMADHQGRVRQDKREDSYWEKLQFVQTAAVCRQRGSREVFWPEGLRTYW